MFPADSVQLNSKYVITYNFIGVLSVTLSAHFLSQ